jgi:DNA-binding LacI/PurR family transcriptional regulator
MLAAIQEEKLDIPKDFQIISLVNRGNIPVWRSPLTRIEHSPEKYGRLLADACLRWFAKRRIYNPMLLRPRFVVGGTTWRKRRKS